MLSSTMVDHGRPWSTMVEFIFDQVAAEGGGPSEARPRDHPPPPLPPPHPFFYCVIYAKWLWGGRPVHLEVQFQRQPKKQL